MDCLNINPPAEVSMYAKKTTAPSAEPGSR